MASETAYLGAAAAAAAAGVDARTICRWIECGRLKATRTRNPPGKKGRPPWLIMRRDLVAAMQPVDVVAHDG